MADPLSIAAGVVGVLTAAAQISSLLIEFTKNSKNAPQTARIVLSEVSDISGTLSQLQRFLLGNKFAEKSVAALLQVDHVIIIMSGCVLTFSELERLLDKLKADGKGILNRIQWARKEKTIASYIQRLQNHKGSLSLVLHILNGSSIIEAKNSIDKLHGIIEHCYQGISSRMESLERYERQRCDERLELPGSAEYSTSIVTVFPSANESGLAELPSDSPRDIDSFDFMEDLRRSWVCRRNNALDSSRLSVFSRDHYSMSWSCLSGASWAEISDISVISLPITMDELQNPLRSTQTWSAGWVNLATIHPGAVELPTTEANMTAADKFQNDLKPACNFARNGRYCEMRSCPRCTQWKSKAWLPTSTTSRFDSDLLFCEASKEYLSPIGDPPLLDNGFIAYKSCTYSCVACGNQCGGYAKLLAFADPKLVLDDEGLSDIESNGYNERETYPVPNQGLLCLSCHRSKDVGQWWKLPTL
ncbi:MAG: hypothetical protein Q9218_006493 [Villophora microphyllina]